LFWLIQLELIDDTLVLVLKTKISYEEAVHFRVGSLHCRGERSTGDQIQSSYNGSGSFVKFPALIADKLINLEVFQYSSTMAFNPYTWGYPDGLAITSEVGLFLSGQLFSLIIDFMALPHDPSVFESDVLCERV